MKTGLPRKSQSDGSDTILEILKDCIVFLNERIYISALYRRHKCVVQVQVCYTSKVTGPKAHNIIYINNIFASCYCRKYEFTQ